MSPELYWVSILALGISCVCGHQNIAQSAQRAQTIACLCLFIAALCSISVYNFGKSFYFSLSLNDAYIYQSVLAGCLWSMNNMICLTLVASFNFHIILIGDWSQWSDANWRFSQQQGAGPGVNGHHICKSSQWDRGCRWQCLSTLLC